MGDDSWRTSCWTEVEKEASGATGMAEGQNHTCDNMLLWRCRIAHNKLTEIYRNTLLCIIFSHDCSFPSILYHKLKLHVKFPPKLQIHFQDGWRKENSTLAVSCSLCLRTTSHPGADGITLKYTVKSVLCKPRVDFTVHLSSPKHDIRFAVYHLLYPVGMQHQRAKCKE